MIHKNRLQHSVIHMCRLFDLSTSGYYAWKRRPLSKKIQEDQRLEIENMAAHKHHRKTYSSERLQKDLAEHGINVEIYRIRRIRKKLGIKIDKC